MDAAEKDCAPTYPLTFVLKVIMRQEAAPGANRRALTLALSEVPLENWSEKTSAAGRYVSYTVFVTVPDHELFLRVHELASKVDGVRYVL